MCLRPSAISSSVGFTALMKSHSRLTEPIVMSKAPSVWRPYSRPAAMRSAVSALTSTGSPPASLMRTISAPSLRAEKRSSYVAQSLMHEATTSASTPYAVMFTSVLKANVEALTGSDCASEAAVPPCLSVLSAASATRPLARPMRPSPPMSAIPQRVRRSMRGPSEA